MELSILTFDRTPSNRARKMSFRCTACNTRIIFRLGLIADADSTGRSSAAVGSDRSAEEENFVFFFARNRIRATGPEGLTDELKVALRLVPDGTSCSGTEITGKLVSAVRN